MVPWGNKEVRGPCFFLIVEAKSSTLGAKHCLPRVELVVCFCKLTIHFDNLVKLYCLSSLFGLTGNATVLHNGLLGMPLSPALAGYPFGARAPGTLWNLYGPHSNIQLLMKHNQRSGECIWLRCSICFLESTPLHSFLIFSFLNGIT